MILNQLIFDVKIINEANGDLINYIPPQMIIGLKMKKVINGIGNLVLTMPFDEQIWNNYKVDRLVEVSSMDYSTNLLLKEETYFFRKREVYYEGNVKQMAFMCWSLESLISRREVKPTNDDNLNSGGFVTRSGVVGDVLEAFSNEQMINPDDANRAFPNLSYNKVSDGNTVGIRTRYEPLMDVFEQLRVNGGVDYKINRTTDNDLEIQVGVLGSDKTYNTNFPTTDYLVFSPTLGNTINPILEESNETQKNVIFVLGEGEGVNQNTLEILGLGISDSVYNRIETTVSSRKGERSLGSANQQALTTGIKKLIESREQKSFKFDILENRLGYRYRVDWNVGDFVTFTWEGEIINFQIKGTTLSVSGNNITRSIDLELEEI